MQELEQIAEEARATVHENGIERCRRLGGIGDHLLEYGTPVIRRTGAGLVVFGSNRQVVRLAMVAQLAHLIRYREIVLGLAGGGHPSIERYGHGGSPPWSRAESTSGGKTRSSSPARWAWMS